MLSMSMSFTLPCPCLLRAFFEYDACPQTAPFQYVDKYQLDKLVRFAWKTITDRKGIADSEWGNWRGRPISVVIRMCPSFCYRKISLSDLHKTIPPTTKVRKLCSIAWLQSHTLSQWQLCRNDNFVANLPASEFRTFHAKTSLIATAIRKNRPRLLVVRKNIDNRPILFNSIDTRQWHVK